METINSGGGGGGGGGLGYPDSLDSSPRSRGAESWDEPFLSSPNSKLRLMCSYGGRIVPRPTDKSLCYLGGETRIVVVERHSVLADLSARVSRTVLGGRPFTLKYQLPNEDLDSLISVTSDDDLENMIEEYDRIAAAAAASGGSTRSSRLRLFLFPSNSESAPSSMGSHLDDSKSQTWFVDALNGAIGMGMDGLPRGFSADSASVNCLLGLEDDSSVYSHGGGAASDVAPSEPDQHRIPRPESSGKLARHGQDVHSVLDSPLLDTSSSFGSTSSAPSLSNLPQIRVRPDDRPPDQRIGGVEEHFTQMNLSAAAATAAAAGQRQEEALYPPPPPIPLPPASASTPTISPTENPSRVFSSVDEKSEHSGVWKPPQQKPTPIDAPISDSVNRPIYYQEKSSAVDPISNRNREIPVSEPSYRMPIPPPDTGYSLPQMQPEQFQQQQHYQQQHYQQQQHPHQQQQQQFIHTNHQYVRPATGTVLPGPSYYQMPYPVQQPQQSNQFDPQMPMYFLPMRPNPSYNLSVQQPNLGDSAANPTGPPLPNIPAKPELPANMYRTAAAAAATMHPAPQAPLVQMAADQAYPYAGMGYNMMQHHRHPSQPATTTMANYGYEYADPTRQPQMYYTQTSSPPPALPPQYQPVNPGATSAPQIHPGGVKQTRA